MRILEGMREAQRWEKKMRIPFSTLPTSHTPSKIPKIPHLALDTFIQLGLM